MSRSKSHPRTDRGYQVFVSHATADKWLAIVLCEKIEAAGAKAFRDDRDIQGGDDIPDTIRRELARSKELLILLTPESVHRPWVLIELGAYWGQRRGQRIVAVLCHVAFDTIPDMIKSKKAIPLNKLDDYLEELGTRVRKAR